MVNILGDFDDYTPEVLRGQWCLDMSRNDGPKLIFKTLEGAAIWQITGHQPVVNGDKYVINYDVEVGDMEELEEYRALSAQLNAAEEAMLAPSFTPGMARNIGAEQAYRGLLYELGILRRQLTPFTVRCETRGGFHMSDEKADYLLGVLGNTVAGHAELKRIVQMLGVETWHQFCHAATDYARREFQGTDEAPDPDALVAQDYGDRVTATFGCCEDVPLEFAAFVTEQLSGGNVGES